MKVMKKKRKKKMFNRSYYFGLKQMDLTLGLFFSFTMDSQQSVDCNYTTQENQIWKQVLFFLFLNEFLKRTLSIFSIGNNVYVLFNCNRKKGIKSQHFGVMCTLSLLIFCACMEEIITLLLIYPHNKKYHSKLRCCIDAGTTMHCME